MFEKNINKVVSQNELKQITDIIKSTDRKVVMTNGCFDILHVGHLNFLEQSKKCGDVLIVAINSDASVKMNKGDSRPINDVQYRCKQMSMISCVDYVVVFEEKTPYQILKVICPDILVKGGDYNIENIVGREFAKETRVIEYLNGFSSTSIIKKMEESKISVKN
jgi:D-beta-D-heptose 7-phosphate kinase/D-beta-D-heptose 1-phosphate adenosyltransferase